MSKTQEFGKARSRRNSGVCPSAGASPFTFGRKAIHGKFISKSHFLHKNIRGSRRIIRYYWLIVIALGILLSVVGFLYAGFVGGLPGPDISRAAGSAALLKKCFQSSLFYMQADWATNSLPAILPLSLVYSRFPQPYALITG